MTVDFVTRTILGITNSDEPFNFTYDSTKKQRKKVEKNSRQELVRTFSQHPHPLYLQRQI